MRFLLAVPRIMLKIERALVLHLASVGCRDDGFAVPCTGSHRPIDLAGSSVSPDQAQRNLSFDVQG
jgi:hypothetical protein